MESSPEKDGDDWGQGWGDDWGNESNESKSNHSKTSPAAEANEKWESWSNEKTSPVQESPPQHDWNNDWGSFDKPTTKSAKSKVNQKKAQASRTGKKGEPATANLIDFGGDSSSKGGADSGWDNEVWAAEDDEQWESLEVTSNNQINSNKAD